MPGPDTMEMLDLEWRPIGHLDKGVLVWFCDKYRIQKARIETRKGAYVEYWMMDTNQFFRDENELLDALELRLKSLPPTPKGLHALPANCIPCQLTSAVAPTRYL